MRIYLDNCAYNRPYDDQTQLSVAMESQSKLHIQADIKEGKLDLVGSYILDYELSRNPFEMRKQPIQRFLTDYVKFYVGPERELEIASIASDIMKTGIKEKDAFHVASAIFAKCDYFISTDIRLLKLRSDKIKMVTPIEFVTEMEGEE